MTSNSSHQFITTLTALDLFISAVLSHGQSDLGSVMRLLCPKIWERDKYFLRMHMDGCSVVIFGGVSDVSLEDMTANKHAITIYSITDLELAILEIHDELES